MRSKCSNAGRVGIAALALSLLSTPTLAKTIKWSGYTWEVRNGDNGGPGPNNWSADNVWIDDQKRLHLKIANKSGKWSCAEITTTMALGFGGYEFDIDTPVANLDDSIVLGLFNYPTPEVGSDGTNEIDIEFATWGGQQKEHGNWTVWPAVDGVPQGSHQFDLADAIHRTENTFAWSSRGVTYEWVPVQNTEFGGVPPGMAEWTYKPADFEKRIPQRPLPVHINLWLFNGKPPTDDKEVEIIVSAFRFTPETAK